MPKLLATLDANAQTQKVTGLPTPTAPSDAATKAYVDGKATGVTTATTPLVVAGANVSLPELLKEADTIGSSLRLLAPGYRVQVGSNYELLLCVNCYYVPATGLFRRIDLAEDATYARLNQHGSFLRYTSPPSSDPIGGWSGGVELADVTTASAPLVKTGSDFALPPLAAEGSTLNLRSDSGDLILGGRFSDYLVANGQVNSGVWNRYDTAQPSTAIQVDRDTGALTLFRALAGANPIAYSTVARLAAIGLTHAELRADGGGLYLGAKLAVQGAANARYDGTNWQRLDVAQPSMLATLNTADGGWSFAKAAAAANPITWVQWAQLVNTSNDTNLRATLGHLWHSGRFGMHFLVNAQYTGSGFTRIDSGLGAAYLMLDSDPARLSLSAAPAGAGAPSFTSLFDLGQVGTTANAELVVAGGYLFGAGLGANYQSANLRFDGTAWNRLDTSQPGYLAEVNRAAGFQFYSAAAGGNPATMTLLARLESANGYPQLRGMLANLILAGQGVQLGGNGYYSAAGWMRENTGLAFYNSILGATGWIHYAAPAGANPVATLTQYGSRDSVKLVQNSVAIGQHPVFGAAYAAFWPAATATAGTYGLLQTTDGLTTLVNGGTGLNLRVGNADRLIVGSELYAAVRLTAQAGMIVLNDSYHYRAATPNSGAVYLNQAGDRYLFWNGSQYTFPGASINANGVTLTSSRALKQDIADVAEGALALINRLRPRQFAFKTAPAQRQTGFILEEAEEVMPETVSHTAGAHPGEVLHGLDYNSIFTTAVKAIQELSAEVAALRARVAALEGA